MLAASEGSPVLNVLEYALDSEPISCLSASDPLMADLIGQIGSYRLELRDDRFTALARSIVGQQLSVAAARTIWSRLVTLLGCVSPEAVMAAEFEQLRGIGLSNAKANYIRDLSSKVLDGSVDLTTLDSLPDAEAIEELTLIKGVGRWTAEMFLIFSLGRPDVFSLGDVGLQRAMQAIYGIERVDVDSLATAAAAWQPYRSVASLYLWEALDRGLLAS